MSNPNPKALAVQPRLFAPDGQSIKFFLQNDTGTHFLSWLVLRIQENGGTVVPTVPLRGYVLIDPSTEKGKRLQAKWQTVDKPHRHVVCYTFVRACIVAERLIPPERMRGARAFFKDATTTVQFHIHPSCNPKIAKELAIDIEKSGGVTDIPEDQARVIIAPNESKKEAILFKDLLRRYEHSTNKYVESIEWVQDALRKQAYEHTKPVPRNMGGRKPGSKRVEYTEEDDKFLVAYIGTRIPIAEHGGRLGNNLYMELTNNPKTYPWSDRHSWHSWRNRYKTRQLIFDTAIAQWLEKNPQPLHAKGQMMTIRKDSNTLAPPKTRKPPKKRKSPGTDEEEEEAAGDEVEDEWDGAASDKAPSRRNTRRARYTSSEPDEGEGAPGPSKRARVEE